MKGLKGFIHTLEVVIALAMITTALIGLFKPLQPADNSAQLIQSGYAALQYLEDTGTLRPAAVANDTVTIRSALQPLLTNFGLEICDSTCAGATGPGTAALDYFISGSGSYSPVHIRLYLW
jgi:hypothetical protein